MRRRSRRCAGASPIAGGDDVTAFDVFSFGVVSASTLYRIEGAFPAAQGYAEITDAQHMIGGEAANSSVVLSRLGVKVKLDGNGLAANEAGRRTRSMLEAYGIDTSRLPLEDGLAGVEEVVFSAGGTRTIFGTYVRLLETAAWHTPDEDDIRRAKAICLDPFFKDASSMVAAIAAGEGIPVITVDCRHDDPLLRHASAVVIAESYLREHYAELAIEDVFAEYCRHCPGLVIFTFGDRDIWYGQSGEPVSTLRPFSIDAVDTAGAGDAFRAGVVYGFLQEWDASRTIEFAAGVSALVCARFPGVLDAPGLDEVLRFIREHRA